MRQLLFLIIFAWGSAYGVINIDRATLTQNSHFYTQSINRLNRVHNVTDYIRQKYNEINPDSETFSFNASKIYFDNYFVEAKRAARNAGQKFHKARDYKLRLSYRCAGGEARNFEANLIDAWEVILNCQNLNSNSEYPRRNRHKALKIAGYITAGGVLTAAAVLECPFIFAGAGIGGAAYAGFRAFEVGCLAHGVRNVVGGAHNPE